MIFLLSCLFAYFLILLLWNKSQHFEYEKYVKGTWQRKFHERAPQRGRRLKKTDPTRRLACHTIGGGECTGGRDLGKAVHRGLRKPRRDQVRGSTILEKPRQGSMVEGF
jgi:hypothetical protein